MIEKDSRSGLKTHLSPLLLLPLHQRSTSPTERHTHAGGALSIVTLHFLCTFIIHNTHMKPPHPYLTLLPLSHLLHKWPTSTHLHNNHAGTPKPQLNSLDPCTHPLYTHSLTNLPTKHTSTLWCWIHAYQEQRKFAGLTVTVLFFGTQDGSMCHGTEPKFGWK